VSAGGQEGTVREIGLFTTIFMTRDNLYVSIPNSSVFSGVTINYTRERTRRIRFNVPVDRSSDLDLVEKTIVEVLRAHPLVLTEPTPPSAVVAEIQECGVIMTVRAMVRSADYWNALYPLRKQVKTALDKAEILYPVTRQAPVVRNEPKSAITAPKVAQEEATQPAAPNGRLETGMAP
jgi:small conductance mechanosensitive channel